MVNRKLFVLAVFLMALVGLSAVSAAESTEDLAGTQTDTVDLETGDDIQVISSENEQTVSEEDIGTFTALKSKIEGASSGDTVYLENDYACEDSWSQVNGIYIDTSNFVIDGKGHTIDAKGQTRIFNISAKNVTIKNITFINAKAIRYGGAIYGSYNDNFSVYGCTFKNNKVVYDGVTYGGGAIYSHRNLSLYECNFVNNSARDLTGGAVYCNKYTISGCRFENNSADIGGAIDSQGGILSDCIFVNNFANSGVSAIAALKSIISGCRFEDNFANAGAGAIALIGGSNVTGCSFVNNHAGDGGAITVDGDGVTVSGCDFENNSANKGGAIFWSQRSKYNVVSGCKFISNNAAKYSSNEEYGGGAIYWSQNSQYNVVSGCKFISNNAGDYPYVQSNGGAIFWYDYCSDNNVSDCDFENNSAYLGGAVYWDKSCYRNSFSNCIFVNNSAYEGGAFFVYTQMSDSSISYCVFVGNTAYNSGGAIEFGGLNCSVNGCIFMNNSAGRCPSIKSRNLDIFNNIFLDYNSENMGVALDNVYCNWLGHDATNYLDGPNLKCGLWLFLNATSNPNPVSLMDPAEITFKLYVYDSTSGNISEYDNTLLKAVNLTITPANGNVDVKTANLGQAIKYAPSGLGNDEITAKIENVFYTFHFDIVKSDPRLSVENQETTYGENTIVLNCNSNATGKVNITLIGKKGTVTYLNLDLNNTIVLPEDIPADEYNVTIAYSGDDNFFNATANATLTVNKAKTELTAKAVKTTYKVNKYLVITLKDGNGKALSGVKVTVNLKGAKTYTTDKNGQVKINVAKLVPKKYTAKIAFAGDDNYNALSAEAKVTVKKAKPKIIAKKITYNAATKTKKFKVTLKDNKGKTIKNAKVRLIVNKIKAKKSTKKFKKNIVKTNKKGKATFKVQRNKKGKYQGTIIYKGNKYYTKATKKVKITIK